jgi:hypothetical protein
MRRLLGEGVGEPALRFLGRLRESFGMVGFTTAEAEQREKASRSGVHAWLAELHRAGAIEQVEAGRGPHPARWRLSDADTAELNRSVLPPTEMVFGEC